MTSSDAPIVVIGDALIDELRDDDGVREFVGGAALNVAVGLARLGRATTLIAMLGDDEPGERVRAHLAQHGVGLIATPSPLGTARAVSTRSGGGEPVYVFNEASKRRRIRYGAAERAAIAAAPGVAVSCVALDDDLQTDELLAAVGGSTLSVDLNPRIDMIADLDRFVRGCERIAAAASLVKVGDEDAGLLYGEGLDPVAARLLVAGAETVLATRGADGATWFTPDGEVSRGVSAMPGPVIDTMGAGDASFAAIVAALADGAVSHAEALERAMDVAAATCRSEGGLLQLP